MALAYDPVRKRTVFWGGYEGGPQSGTWEYDGTKWESPSSLHSPPATSSGAAAFDPVQNHVVSLGGVSAVGRTAAMWRWDGRDWTLETGPYGFGYGGMVWDSWRRRLVAFGGQSGNITPLDVTFEY